MSRLFSGIGDFLDDSRSAIDQALLEFWAQYTTDPIGQLVHLGFSRPDIEHLSTERARKLLVAVRKRATNMSPGRLQGLLQDAGFDVYVHEWWASGPPWVERDPTTVMVKPRTGSTRCGQTSARCGVPSARCSRFLINDPNYLVNQSLLKTPPPWPEPSGYRGIFYIGGKTFPGAAIAAEADRRLLEFLVLRFKRASQWAVLLVIYAPESLPAMEQLTGYWPANATDVAAGEQIPGGASVVDVSGAENHMTALGGTQQTAMTMWDGVNKAFDFSVAPTSRLITNNSPSSREASILIVAEWSSAAAQIVDNRFDLRSDGAGNIVYGSTGTRSVASGMSNGQKFAVMMVRNGNAGGFCSIRVRRNGMGPIVDSGTGLVNFDQGTQTVFGHGSPPWPMPVAGMALWHDHVLSEEEQDQALDYVCARYGITAG